ncbi:hemolysin family protein [Desulfocurvibacter africanus]|uniref:hemolysin family protein n=1 Tax=Desulfocurvibacter africanus TaxID=873 RepID=UPI0004893193|nr:hemolysin family protein [Desulfocurvibacter africanus]
MFELIMAMGLAAGISFVCSLSEAALYSVPWSRIEDLRRQKKKSGEILFQFREHIERPITAILTLNTIANTAGASIAGAAAAEVFGAESLPLFVVVFTVIILIFSEIIPKTLGVSYTRTVAPLLTGPISIMILTTAPLIWALGLPARLGKRRKRGPQTTEDDIRATVSLVRKAGLIKPYEELSIRNILSLDQKSVEQTMTPRTVVFSLPAELTVAQARATTKLWPHSRIPVYEGEDREDIVGLVYRRELLEALANDQDDLRLEQMMKPVEFVQETTTLDKVLNKFLESRNHLLVVLDEYGGLSGVISLEDVLEEILGKEIVDETDQVVDMRELARSRKESLVRGTGREPDGRSAQREETPPSMEVP